MSKMILIYTTCKNLKEANEIGKHLLNKHLCACINIFPQMQSSSLWPPKSGKIENSKETVLLIKTLDKNYSKVEKEIKIMHSYKVPSIFAIPIVAANGDYFDWMKSEIL